MRGKFVTGAILGAVAGMLILPQLDKNTKRRIKRSSKMVRNTTGDMFETMKDWIK